MRVSSRWLQDYVDLPTTDPGKLAHTLAMLGHEVEGIDHVDTGWDGVVAARVEAVEAHPDADRIRVCTVTTGEDPITVVCGAWNFEAGAMVAFAPPGSTLPGDFAIGVRPLRGVDSHGMICSEKELGVGDDAEGILVLPSDTPIGRPLEDVLPLPDTVFDLAITPNRPDAMSMIGIARDLAAWYGSTVKLPSPDPTMVAGDPGLTIDIEDPVGNPRFVARRVDDIEVSTSPLWMRMRLRSAGIRPISNLVDITNYVMLELGQPLHVFDVDRLSGSSLTVRRAQPGEKLRTLDGVDRRLTDEDLVICDGDGPTSLAGTMGGENSEVSTSTRSVLIEAATWDPPLVMYMSRRHQLRSEASARFERGVDPELPPLATLRAGELILELAGGSLREGFIDAIAREIPPVTVELKLGDVTRILGPGFDSARVTDLLTRLGFAVSGSGPLTVVVPSYRPDVTRAADLVEEVARLAGYDSFGERLRLGSGGGLAPEQRQARRIRQSLVGIGYSQTITLPFVMPAEVAAFDAPTDHELNQTVEVKNPLSEEEAVLRPALLPGLLRVLKHNRNRGHADVAVFEQGRVFHGRPWAVDRRVPDQPVRLAVAATGVIGPRDLAGHGQIADVHTVLAAVRHLAASLGLSLTIEEGEAPGYHPTRTARISVNGAIVGHAGELHPVTAAAFELEGRVAVCELDMYRLLGSESQVAYRPVSPYPPADFDLSFEVPIETSAGRLAATVAEAGGDLLEWVRIFDEFTGSGLGEGRKAIAVRVRLRAGDRTLQAEDIARVREAMIEAGAGAGASLRGNP